MSSAQILWDNWYKYDDLDDIYRQGFLKIKAYGYGNKAKKTIKKYHVDSTLTHSGRTAMLFSDMMDLWPSYFKDIDKYLALKVALNHDIGELVVGDVPDDGRKAHELKKDPEWEAIMNHYFNLPDEVYLMCKDIHWQFEEARTFLGQSIKLADKLDFVAKLIRMEGQGYNLNAKAHFSVNDWVLARETGNHNFVDIVANHLRHMMKKNHFDKRLVQIAIGFITCGLDSIYRPFFEWWPPREL